MCWLPVATLASRTLQLEQEHRDLGLQAELPYVQLHGLEPLLALMDPTASFVKRRSCDLAPRLVVRMKDDDV